VRQGNDAGETHGNRLSICLKYGMSVLQRDAPVISCMMFQATSRLDTIATFAYSFNLLARLAGTLVQVSSSPHAHQFDDWHRS
jgi:hypothetical protein